MFFGFEMPVQITLTFERHFALPAEINQHPVLQDVNLPLVGVRFQVPSQAVLVLVLLVTDFAFWRRGRDVVFTLVLTLFFFALLRPLVADPIRSRPAHLPTGRAGPAASRVVRVFLH